MSPARAYPGPPRRRDELELEDLDDEDRPRHRRPADDPYASPIVAPYRVDRREIDEDE